MSNDYRKILKEHFLGKWKNVFGVLDENGQVDMTQTETQVRKYIKQVSDLYVEAMTIIFEGISENKKLSDEQKANVKDALNEFMKKLEEYYVTDENIDKFSKKMSHIYFVHDRCVKEKITLMPYMNLTDFDYDTLVSRLESGDTMVKFYSDLFSSTEHCNKLKKEWSESDVLKSRSNILNQAVDLHFEKKYDLSVPIFLIHINAIFDEIMYHKIPLHIRKDDVKDIISKKALDNNLHKDFLKDSVFLIVIEEILRAEKDGPSEQYPNRHAILHGRDLEYGTEEHSLRCISVVDAFRKANLLQAIG